MKVLAKEIAGLLASPAFLVLTAVGNSTICLFSLAFYWLEAGKNPRLHEFIDALWWGFSTATTTGYGDITPVTTPGKILGIVLMLTGLALFGMFTALFAESILMSTKHRKG